LTEEQKRGLQSLTFYPIDPAYRVKARLLPIEIKKNQGGSLDGWKYGTLPRTFVCGI